ncbi:MAG: uracil-DNA glycosylase [Deltaproteobacteria bacterium]|nr:uracil-DNA glycosylase [Deltaproteobacteria bacterium]
MAEPSSPAAGSEADPRQELRALIEGLRGLLLGQEETGARFVSEGQPPPELQPRLQPPPAQPLQQRRQPPPRWPPPPLELPRPLPAVRSPSQPPGSRPSAPVSHAVELSTGSSEEERLSALRGELEGCQRCKLAAGRHSLVFGTGDPRPRLLFVGEGPGEQEDLQGVPFVGKAGQLLDAIIEKGMGLSRREVYIANIVKCRPPGNRDPQPDEVAACLPFLRRQIAILRPEVIVTLGRIAVQTLLASDASLTRLRGSWHDFDGLPLRATFHPAYLLRYPEQKAAAWEDVKEVLGRLGLQRPGR